MSRKLQLVLIVSSVVAISSAVSHAAVHWLGIKSTWSGYQHYGPQESLVRTVLHGSSPAYSDLDWTQISHVLGGSIESWATAGSSPSEWEIQYRRSPNATRAFVVVSPADLNEYFLCDFRGDIVPLLQTIRDLWQSRTSWELSRRILGQYAVSLVRKLFPTVGRSDGVMVGIRTKLRTWLGHSTDTNAEEAPKFGATGPSEDKEQLSGWPESHVQRRLVLFRASCNGKHAFNGPKKLALERLLRRAEKQGQVTLVVLPVSPIYQNAFLSAPVMHDFKATLIDVQRRCPRVKTIFLDQLPDLNNNDYYSDFVHMNMYGQQIATKAFLERLKALGIAP